LQIRVYYADTDAGLVVHHARFIEFFERARTEWLRELAAGPLVLAAQGLIFVLRDLHAEYLVPGRLDDQLELELHVSQLGRSQATVVQEAKRGDELLARLTVQMVCVSLATMKSTQVPDWLRAPLAADLAANDPGRPTSEQRKVP